MIIVHIKNIQSRSTESIYIQNLIYIILMEKPFERYLFYLGRALKLDANDTNIANLP